MWLKIWRLPEDASRFIEDFPSDAEVVFEGRNCENAALALANLHSRKQRTNANYWGMEAELDERAEELNDQYFAAVQRSVRRRGEVDRKGYDEAKRFEKVVTEFYSELRDGTVLVFGVSL